MRTAPLWLIAAVVASASAQPPLNTVHYFNPYQHPKAWTGTGSQIYEGGTADVKNVDMAIPVASLDGREALMLDSVNPPGGWWNVYFKVSGNPMNWLRIGANPAVHLQLKWTAIPGDGAWDMAVQVGAAQVKLSDYVKPSREWQDVYIPVAAFRGKAALDLTRVGAIVMAPLKSYGDRCVVYLAALDVVPSAGERAYADYVKVDQVGYLPRMATKLAVVSYEPDPATPEPTTFRVLSAATAQVVYTGSLVRVKPDNGWDGAGDIVFQGDFGALQTAGAYIVDVPELKAKSQRFRIGDDVYDRLLRDVLRYYYYCRSAETIQEPYGEGFARIAYHAENAKAAYNYDSAQGHFHYGANATRDVHGCWFDAGDTHVQVPDTTVTLWYLLEFARDFGQKVKPGALNMPDGKAGVGDMVPLTMYAIDWMKRMQNPDGSMHYYVMGPGPKAAQQISDISSQATALGCAAYAKTYAVLGHQLPAADAADLLRRANLAWAWLKAHPELVKPGAPRAGGADPEALCGGANAANLDRQYRAFAAIELFEATGAEEYDAFFRGQFKQNGQTPLRGPVFGSNTTGWGGDNVINYLNPLGFGLMDYARSHRQADAEVQQKLKSAFLHQADCLKRYVGATTYRIPMLYPGHLFWGSNGAVLAPSAMVLARAYEWTHDKSYQDAAAEALHFILGRNPVNRVFVSGYGDYQHGSDFYSQYWTDLLRQPPGALGGNIHVEGSAKPVVEHPWKRFINTQDADMTEPGVYWNASFAWLVGYFAREASPG